MSYDDESCRSWYVDQRFNRLAANMEQAASLAAIHHLGYTKGFSDATTLREFCDDYVPEPYFPVGDSRPTAERLGWDTTTNVTSMTN